MDGKLMTSIILKRADAGILWHRPRDKRRFPSKVPG